MHEYKCANCGLETTRQINSIDLTGKGGRIKDLVEYQRRIDTQKCECGGILKHKLSKVQEAIFFSPQRGKISRRFA